MSAVAAPQTPLGVLTVLPDPYLHLREPICTGIEGKGKGRDGRGEKRRGREGKGWEVPPVLLIPPGCRDARIVSDTEHYAAHGVCCACDARCSLINKYSATMYMYVLFQSVYGH